MIKTKSKYLWNLVLCSWIIQLMIKPSEHTLIIKLKYQNYHFILKFEFWPSISKAIRICSTINIIQTSSMVLVSLYYLNLKNKIETIFWFIYEIFIANLPSFSIWPPFQDFSRVVTLKNTRIVAVLGVRYTGSDLTDRASALLRYTYSCTYHQVQAL